MSGIVSRAFILFADGKDKKFTSNFLQHCFLKSTVKDRIYTFLVKMVDMCRKR